MNFELGHLFFAGVVYLLLLFFIAYATEQGWIPDRIVRHPLTYALSLGVYATTWSFYGSVGFAESQGFNFLAIYIGVTLVFALAPILLAPLLRLTREYQLTSLADILAFRYRSQWAGVFVTVFMLCVTFPYIALQIRAVTESAQILTQEATPRVLALGFCMTLILFAILFGARHVSPREKHEGLVVAIAFESLVKLGTLWAVGLFALFGVFDGFNDLDQWLLENPKALEALYAPVREGPWVTLLFLAFCAGFLLPRQFHMAFTENIEERSLYTAAWAFPLFLLLMNLFIPVILWAAWELQVATRPDYYVLGITLSSGGRLLPAIAFIGGISAASAMMIVTTLALSSMCLNHLVLPALYPDPGQNLYRWILWGRRTLIALIILAGYGFYLLLEKNQGLVQLGLISFVAVAQFLPGIVGLLFWRRATRIGFISGLTAGALIWAITLLLPLLHSSAIIPGFLSPMSYLGDVGNPWEFATFASMAANFLLFVTVSLFTEQSEEESEAAEACRRTTLALPSGVVLTASSPTQFREQLALILGPEAAGHEVNQALADLEMDPGEENPRELRRLRERIERNLSGLMGPMLARMIVDERLRMDPSARTALTDNIRFIENRLTHSQTQLQGLAAELDGLRRYHQQILRDLPLGVCAIDQQGQVVSWNLALEILSGVTSERVEGAPLSSLPETWSSMLGDFLQADDQHKHKVQIQSDGRGRWFNLHKAAIADPSAPGETGGVVVLIEDLTDIQALEGELAHSERLASIGRLAAGVAHEIGNPVTGIACLAQNLESETADPQVQETSRQMLEQTQRITDIVQTLVGFSHGGTITGDTKAELNLRDCIEEAARLVRLSHMGKQVQCHNRCPADIEIVGDRPRLQQVFVNLMSNACDASQPGDTVEIVAAVERDKVAVHVIDHGAGIPDNIIDQIFEPFVTTKPPGKGTGLGLPVVHRIVQVYGGPVSIESTPGRGTRVSVLLPSGGQAADMATSQDEAERG
ncbi:MAG: histidine kinase [Gammaproteobacteria bacterium]|nr:MAG: histidine kinase [Gammaproteobacteria bacterium]